MLTVNIKPTKCLLVLLMQTLIACTTHQPKSSPSTQQDTARTDFLTGVWSVRLAGLEEFFAPSEGPSVVGEIALLKAPPLPGVVWNGVSAINYVGTYDVPVERWGVGVIERRDIRVAGAQFEDGATVVIMLNPGPDHGSLIMRGHIAADSIIGDWVVIAYAGGARGHFTMKRIR